jgi:hypothetical protein
MSFASRDSPTSLPFPDRVGPLTQSNSLPLRFSRHNGAERSPAIGNDVD